MFSPEQDLVGRFTQMIVELREPSKVWPAMLEALQQVIGFDAGYIGASWRNAAEGRGAVADHDEPLLRKNLGRYLAEIRPEEVALYTDQARVHHDVWSPDRQKELAVFREVLFPTGMAHMIVRTSVRHGNLAGFNLERRSSSEPFSDRDLRLVDLIAPFMHLVEVLTLNAQDEDISSQFTQDHSLTPRETEFITLAAKGLTNSEIAILKGISPNTVRNTLVRIFEKVGVSNRVELTYTATRKTHSALHPPAVPAKDDGLQAFAERVRRASDSQPARPAQSRSSSPRIVYTAPLFGLPRS